MEKAEENPGSRGDRPPNPRGRAREPGKSGGNFKKNQKKQKKRKFFLTLFPFGCIFSFTVADDGRRQKPAGCLTVSGKEKRQTKSICQHKEVKLAEDLPPA